MDFYGTIGPACCTQEVLEKMYANGMTGIRLNLSHGMLEDHRHWLTAARKAAEMIGKKTKILVDLQGPELRIGTFEGEILLNQGENICFDAQNIPLPEILYSQCEKGMHLLLDDGKIEVELLECKANRIEAIVLRGGILKPRKSIAVIGKVIHTPTLTEKDLENIKVAKQYGVTGVMLPFVRNAEDLICLKETLKAADADDIAVFAKIENMQGVLAIESFMELADEMVIARGDLGNAMPLWELPRVQKKISRICRTAKKPFMVVTQMLDSMEHRQVPTRAEVSDIYNAVLDGASSVMLTGETAVGEYPEIAMMYLVNTAKTAMGDEANEY